MIWNRPKLISGFVIVITCCMLESGCKKTAQNSKAKVVGGELSEQGYLPVVGLLTSFSKSGGSGCTGTIVQDNLVLLVAHCFKAEAADDLFVSARVVDSFYGDLTKRQLETTTFVAFPGAFEAYMTTESARHATDVAFLVFPRNTFSDTYKANISSTSPAPGEKVTVIGYGETQMNDANPSTDTFIRHVGTNQVSGIDEDSAYAIRVETQQVAKTSAVVGHGDSGGPLLKHRDDPSKTLEIFGIADDVGTRGVVADDVTHNCDIGPKNTIVSYYVNLKNRGVAAFINAVMSADQPTADLIKAKNIQPDLGLDADKSPSVTAPIVATATGDSACDK